MPDHPILFNAEMVRAIRDGRKTQTRRIVKPQPVGNQRLIEGLAHVTVGMDPADDGAVWYVGDCVSPGIEVRPKYRPGDRLWVKEKWAEGGRSFMLPCGEYAWSSHRKARYAATDDAIRDKDDSCHWRTRPSIHMPRWASRITLAVEAVRVERVQDISAGDLLAEGMTPTWGGESSPGVKCASEYDQFADLWDRVNGPGAWERNDWVWVYTFAVEAK